jgi:DNA-binding CsgD family transcriptional regulator
VQKVLDRALAKEPEGRYPQVGDMAQELMAAVFGREISAPIVNAVGSPASRLDGLLGALELLVSQARAYELALPPGNYAARAAAATLGEQARRALNEARDLADAQFAAPAAKHPFSPRELEVLGLAAQGLTNKEIAYRLGISERTIQFHMNSVFNKTGAQSRTEAAALALKNGWIT